MVMDGLSAQSVGREFVRQYYTMLHEAPKYLHRFYSHDSSFLHDGMTSREELPAIGQAEINRSIESLNLRDCHARIRQVDSQPSVSGSVVIQVVGELSNNGVPLRRFMQTFVLVPQSPKKFYVHNDIFRYQDEVFSEGMLESNAEVPQQIEETLPTAEEAEAAVEAQVEESVDLGYQGDDESPNGTNSETAASETEGDAQQQPQQLQQPQQQQQAQLQQPQLQQHDDVIVQETEGPRQGEGQAKSLPQQPEQPPVKLSWAAMAKKGVARNGLVGKHESASQEMLPKSFVPEPQQQQRQPQLQQRQPQQQQQAQEVLPREQQADEESAADKTSRRSDTEEDASKVMQQYPDNQQVFIGNIPHNMPDAELHDFFAKFGTVLDIRINRKNNNNLPNFGFVLFESAQVVQSILEQRPLYYGKQRVNVEEKKRKSDLQQQQQRPRSRGGKFPRGGAAAAAKNGPFPRNRNPPLAAVPATNNRADSGKA